MQAPVDSQWVFPFVRPERGGALLSVGANLVVTSGVVSTTSATSTTSSTGASSRSNSSTIPVGMPNLNVVLVRDLDYQATQNISILQVTGLKCATTSQVYFVPSISEQAGSGVFTYRGYSRGSVIVSPRRARVGSALEGAGILSKLFPSLERLPSESLDEAIDSSRGKSRRDVPD